MPKSSPSFSSSLQLAHEAATLLEHTNTCQVESRRVENALRQLARAFKHLPHDDNKFFQAEVVLRRIVAMLREVFYPSEDIFTVLVQLIDAKRAGQVLLDVANHVLVLVRICLDSPEEPQYFKPYYTAEDKVNLENEIERYRINGHPRAADIQLILKSQPDINLVDILNCRAGTRMQQQDLQYFTEVLRGEQEFEMATLPPGKVSLDFPQRIIGEGSFGQVLLGVLHGEGSNSIPVAVKRVRNISGLAQLVGRKTLIDEAQNRQGLRHPNIVCLFGTCIIQRKFHLVMDKCDLTLKALLYAPELGSATSSLRRDEIDTILLGITRGLSYLHSQNLLHRNLNPMNVLLSQDLGLVKLTGFAQTARPSLGAYSKDPFSLIQAYVYKSPEVLHAPAQWTTHADVYSLGMMIWEIYHEEIPFKHLLHDLDNLKCRVIAGERPVIAEQTSMERRIIRIMESCWSEEPEARPTAARISKEMKSQIRPARLIHELTATLSKRNRRARAEHCENTLRIQDLVRNLSGEREKGILLQRLVVLLEILKDGSKADPNVKGLHQVRREMCKLGILFHLQRILKNEQNDADVIDKALDIFVIILAEYDYRKAAIKIYDMNHALISIMQQRVGGQHVRVKALLCVEALALHREEYPAALVRDLGVEIVAMMRAYPTTAEVLGVACRTLHNLAEISDRNREILGQDLNVGEEILAVMCTHQTNANLQQSTCEALRVLASNYRNREILGQDLYIGAEILDAMRTHRTNADVQKHACAALWNLAANNDRNREILGHDLNVGAEIVAAMRAHRTNADVQEKACGALKNLAANARNKEILGHDLNVGAEIVAAMRAHRTNADVQEEACGALWNLAVNDRNQEILGQDLNVGADIVAAMRAHRTNADVQKEACGALWNLATDDRNKEILGQDLNVGAEIVAAMRAHRTNADVQKKACGALWNLAFNNDRNKEILGQDLNVVPDVVDAVRAHRMNGKVEDCGVMVLRNLASNDRNYEILEQYLNDGKETLFGYQTRDEQIVTWALRIPISESLQERYIFSWT